MVADVRQNALDVAAELEKEEDDVLDDEEANETVVTAALHEAFAKYQERWHEDDHKPQAKKGKKGLAKLSAADVAAIVDCEKVELLSHQAIAHRHNISTALVGRVVRAARKNADYCSQREDNERCKDQLTDSVRQLIGDWKDDEYGMLSLGRLKKRLREETEHDCSTTKLRQIMRRELGLRYKKVKQLAPQTNRLKNLVCRQQYALKMLEVLASGRRVINVDESWLNTMAYRRHSWTKVGKSNARPTKELSTRVAILAAIDNRGKAYISLGTSNTDSCVMLAFFSQLCKSLDCEDSSWREHSVVLLDNASYHRSAEVRAGIKKLGVPTIYSGPYSYVSAPVELFFALLKRSDLNPERLQLGKR